MPSLLDLPVELHSLILKLHLSSIRKACTPEGVTRFTQGKTRPDEEFEWLDKGSQSKSLFPYNAASVCQLWLDILVKIPQCWTRLVFDVNTPPRFLDAFSWSKDQIINVVVYSSALDDSNEDDEDRDEKIEASHVAAVLNSLRPHIRRCSSISFNVVFDTSLPHSVTFFMGYGETPHLKELTLDSEVSNMPSRRKSLVYDKADCCEIDAREAYIPQELRRLSMPAYWFVRLIAHKHTRELFHCLDETKLNCLTLYELQFGDLGSRASRYLERFIGALCMTSRSMLDEIDLSDLSLSQEYVLPTLREWPLLREVDRLSFCRVSRSVLQYFDLLAGFDVSETLAFNECTIPPISRFHSAEILVLEDITEEDVRVLGSLKNVLRSWKGRELRVSECPSFDDDLLSWLQQELPDGTFPAERLVSLTIQDCPRFTPTALRRFIDSRKDAHRSYQPVGTPHFCSKLDELNVGGTCPPMAEEDKEWFVSSANMRVRWGTTSSDGLFTRFYNPIVML